MFLSSGTNLTSKIQEVMTGENPRMAVAFLGRDLAKNVFKDKLPVDLKVICDIEMGGTNPDALFELGAPGKDFIRHLPETEMHAKLYLSDTGAVIASANASTTALSSDSRVEVGFFAETGTTAYKEAKKWFEKLYARTAVVDDDAIFLARATFHRPRRPTPFEKHDKCHIIEFLRNNADKFGDVGFVLTETADDKRAEEYNQEFSPNQQRTEAYFEWGESLPEFFIGLHRGDKRVYEFQNVKYVEESDVVIAMRCNLYKIFDLPKFLPLSKKEIDLLSKKVEKWDAVYNAEQLRCLLAD